MTETVLGVLLFYKVFNLCNWFVILNPESVDAVLDFKGNWNKNLTSSDHDQIQFLFSWPTDIPSMDQMAVFDIIERDGIS